MPPLTELEHAARDGNLPRLIRLCKMKILFGALSSDDVVSRKGALGCTLLHHACIQGHYDIVYHLGKKMHVDVDALNDAWETPIHCASYAGHAMIVQFLLEWGANQLSCDHMGRTALHVAASQGHLAVVMRLVENHPQNVHSNSHLCVTPLHGACYRGHLEVARYLVNFGRAHVNAQKDDGKTPLHLACQMNHLDVVMFLVESCRANIQARSKSKETPLHIASKKGCFEVVRYLVIHGRAKLNALDCFNRSPLRVAMSKKHDDVVAFLLSQGVPDNVLLDHEEDDITNLTGPEDLSPPLDTADDENSKGEYTDLATAGTGMDDYSKQSEYASQRLALLERQFLGTSNLTSGASGGEDIATRLDRLEKTCGLYAKSDSIYEPDLAAEDKVLVSAIVGTAQDDDDETVWVHSDLANL